MDRAEKVSETVRQKLARQLDFTANRREPVHDASPLQSESWKLPHLQLELQLRSGAQQQPQPPTSELSPQPERSLPLKTPQLQSSPLQRLVHHQLPSKQAREQQSPMQPKALQSPVQSSPVYPRIRHPMQKLPAAVSMECAQEPPASRVRSSHETKDGTPKRQKRCNCKSSQCLKLYCECYAAGMYCEGCNCMNCQNNADNEAVRQVAIEATLARNPNAFKSKIENSPCGRHNKEEAEALQIVGKHNKGCQCKKSGCLKKYCECFQAGVLCSENCRCKDCKNFEGSEERRAVYQVGTNTYIHQAANAAICGAIGSSGFGVPPRKGNTYGGATNGTSTRGIPKLEQDIHQRPISFPIFEADNTNRALFRTSTYSSPFANILQPQDVKNLCSLLVVTSTKAQKIYAEKERESANKPADMDNEGTNSENQMCRAREVKRTEACGSVSDVNLNEDRAVSPRTLGLMCDERDTSFLEDGIADHSRRKSTDSSSNLHREEEKDHTRTYAEQEKLVLTTFYSFLNNLISSVPSANTEDSTRTTAVVKSEITNKQELQSRSNGHSRREGEL